MSPSCQPPSSVLIQPSREPLPDHVLEALRHAVRAADPVILGGGVTVIPHAPHLAANGNPLPDGWMRGVCRGCAAVQLVNVDGDCVDCADPSVRACGSAVSVIYESLQHADGG